MSDDVVVELIDRLERHKAAVLGISDLKIGMATVAQDFTDCIRMLHYLRDRMLAFDKLKAGPRK